MAEIFARDSLSVTSQFYYCGLPLRLDSYSRCQFNCLYCFAKARGGYRGSRQLRIARVMSIRKRLERAHNQKPQSVLDELLAHRQPIHFGGMSDPFLPIESVVNTSLQLLKILAEYQYPTVISTKSDLCIRDEYLQVLKQGNFILQVSMSSMDDKLLAQIDAGTPGPKAMLEALTTLHQEDIPAICRIQPLLPSRETDAYEVIDACATAGVKHVAVEHLKLPIERSWAGTRRLSTALNIDLETDFVAQGSRCIGREMILPPEKRLERVLDMRDYAHQRGLRFGAADNDFLLLSDGICCCSGVDFFKGFTNSFRFNYTEAVRRGIPTKLIAIDSLEEVWCPSKSISQYVNSHSRIKRDSKNGAGMKEYIQRNWNSTTSGNSPLALYGVIDTGEYDRAGYKLYTFTNEMLSLLHATS